MLVYTRYSSGDFVREITKKKKMTLAEYNTKAEQQPQMDHEVDEKLRDLRDHNDIVIDSRLGFYWIPESFKVYLDLDADVAIARIYRDATLNTMRSTAGESSTSMDDIVAQVEERMQNERRRFKKLYGVNPFSIEHFDLVIDTSRHSPQTVALTVFDTYKKWLSSESWKQVISRVPLGYSYKNEY